MQKEASSDNQLNDKQTIFPNIVFDTILKNRNVTYVPLPPPPNSPPLPPYLHVPTIPHIPFNSLPASTQTEERRAAITAQLLFPHKQYFTLHIQ